MQHRARVSLSMVVAALAAAAGTTHAVEVRTDDPTTTVAPDASGVLSRAGDLLAKGRVVWARTMLSDLTRHASLTLSDQERAQAFELLRRADRRVRDLPMSERVLQEAEVALVAGDVLTAVRKAGQAAASTEADDELRERAGAIVSLAEARRSELADRVPAMADRAGEAFNAQRYSEAKGLLDQVVRSGVKLDVEREAKVADLRTRLVDLEMANGQAFETPISAAMFAPDAEWLLSQPSDVTISDSSNASTTDIHSGEGWRSGEQTTSGTGANSGSNSGAARDGSYWTSEQPASGSDPVDASRRYAAQELLGEADLAFEERRMQEALTKYDRLLTEFDGYLSADELSRASSRRSEARLQLRTSGGPSTDVLTDELADRGLQRQRFEQTYANLLTQADQALTEGDTDRARNLVAQARVELNQNRDVLAEEDYEGKLERIELKITEINAREEEIRTREQAETAAQLEQQSEEIGRQRRDERDNKIIELINQVRDLQLEMRYEEALDVVDQILMLDPINPTGLLLRDVIQDAVIYRQYFDFKRERNLSYAQESVRAQEAMILPDKIIAYPDDWPSITERRGQPLDFADTPANRTAMAALSEEAPPITFDNNLLVDVLGVIQSASGINMDVDWESLADIGVDQDSTVSLRLDNVSLETVLDRVLQKVSEPDLPAAWAIQDGVLVIASDDVLRLNTTLELYDIRDLLFEIPNFDNAPEFDLGNILSQSGQRGGSGGQSPFSGGTDDPDRVDLEVRVQDIVDIIQNNIDTDGWIDLGGDTGAIDELNGNLIITQTPRNHRRIIGLLNKLREVRNMQINVEARFLLVDENFFEQIGLDLDVYFNKTNEFDINRLLDPSLDLSDLFDPETGELLDNISGGGVIVDTDGDGVPDAVFNQPQFPPGTQGDQFSVIRAAQNSFGLTETLASVNSFASNILASAPALGITGRFLDDIQVDVLVEATQADQRSVTLTAPRLTFTNGQRAFIAVTTSQTFVSDLQPVVSDSSTAFDPQISAIPSGVVLDIEGVVSADRRYVTLNVIATNSSVTFADELEFEGAAGGGGLGGGGGAVASAAIQIPVVDGSTLNTTVTVPDQGTVMLGGQKVVSEVEVETGVPVLSKIPFLSRFFSNRIDAQSEQTLMILIKPTILIQDEEEDKAFPGLLDSIGY